MKKFTLFWQNGVSELIEANDYFEAISKTPKKGRVVYFQDGDVRNDYQYDSILKTWSPKSGVTYKLEFFPLEVKDEGKDKYGNTIRSFFIDDTAKNKLIVKQNDKIITLILKLGTTKDRLIGTVTKSTRTIEINRIRGKHLFWSGNAYGFNHYVFKNQSSIDWIRLSDDTGSHWKIPVKYLLDYGKFLHFKSQGFELQQFISLAELEKFRVNKEENRRF